MKKIVLCHVLVVVLLFLTDNVVQAKNGKKGLMARVGHDLAKLYREYEVYVKEKGSDVGFSPSNTLLRLSGNRVLIDIVSHGEADLLKSELKGLGLKKGSHFGKMVSGQLPVRSIQSMAALARFKAARPAYAITNIGAVTSQGDRAMRSDIARGDFSVDGAGVTVGILSDSFNCLGSAAADESSGDLPSGIIVLEEEADCLSGTDEGRAMMQLIYDVAPGTQLMFHTAFHGMADFAVGIQEQSAAGAQVIVDDVIYLAEPMFQDGIIAQAVDEVVADGVAYFSSAGNQSRNSYEDISNFVYYLRPDSLISPYGGPPFYGGDIHSFDQGADPENPFDDIVSQEISVPAGSTLIISFQWDDPFYSVCGHPSPNKGCSGAVTDMDIYLTDALGLIITGGVDSNIGGDPVEIVGVSNTGTSDVIVNLMIVKYDGPNPSLMKYVRFGGEQTAFSVTEGKGTVYGHANAEGAEAVGAAFYGDTPEFSQYPPLLETYSSAGGTPILIDPSGTSIGPDIRSKPEIVGPDCTNTTFFWPALDLEPDGFPNFCGTSASAPHAAGVAALMLHVNPSLSPDEVYTALESTAIDMNSSGFDHDSGFGFIQADSALGEITPPGDCIDSDNDGWCVEDGDCDDNNSALTPETFWYQDSDSDGYGTITSSLQQCIQPTGYVFNNLDYDDNDPALGPPARIEGSAPKYYLTLQEAYDAAGESDVIQCIEATFAENVSIDSDKSVTIQGGFDGSYSTITGNTTINGDMDITNGMLTIENFIFQ